MSAAVLAFGAASALGVGAAAFDVGVAGAEPPDVWSERGGGKAFARVQELDVPHVERPRALFELGLDQLLASLDARLPAWRGLRVGVAIGTSSGGLAAFERARAGERVPLGDCAYFSPLRGLEAALGRRPERLVSLYAACASSTMALGLGLRWLELGDVDLALVGGYDAESDWVCSGFDALKATSAGKPRPFRAERDGMALGEGVALVALGRDDGSRALGYVRGFAATTDAVHITAPDRTGQALARAATAALADAAIGPERVDFVSVHGTGTSFNDAAEGAALTRVFGEAAPELALHAFKSVVGHTLGAAGALESLAVLSAFQHGVVPASAGAGTPMPELPARVPAHNVVAKVSHCLKLSTAFGGANAALVLAATPREPSSRLLSHEVRVAAVGSSVTALDPARVLPWLRSAPERLPRSDALSELCVAAAAELVRLVQSAGLELDLSRTGVVVGSSSASLQADAEFGARILERGPGHAEPRRFPATSPNACAGHVAIAFGLGGPSHAVGAGAQAATEALEVARDWLRAGDAAAMLVIGAENVGEGAHAVVEALGLPRATGAQALLLTHDGPGWLLGRDEPTEFGRLVEAAEAGSLPGAMAFGTVRRPE